jgi:hypothetical protein
MKHQFASWAAFLAMALAAQADPLNKQHVAGDAKWLIHLDCDNLRRTQIGDFLLQNLLAPKLAEATGDLKFNLSNVVQRISSVTAYGTDFSIGPVPTGVLLINTDTETQKALEGLLVAQILANTNGPVKKLEGDGAQSVYSFANQVFIAPEKGGPIVISKSQAQLDATRELLAGKGPSLATSKNLNEFPVIANSFFFVGLADAASLPNSIPAQAKVLQMADGGRIALGEKEDRVFLDLALRGKTVEVTRQIQQVIEGMVALVSLGQPENAELTELVKSTKVAAADQVISISVNYPTSKVIARLKEGMAPKLQKDKPAAKQKAKARAKAKQKPTPAAPDSDKLDEPASKPEAEATDK